MAAKSIKKGSKKTTKEHLTDSQREELKKMVMDRVSPTVIAATLGVAISTVHYQKKRLKNNGLKIPSVQRGRIYENDKNKQTQSGIPGKHNITPPSPAAGQPNSQNSPVKPVQVNDDPGNSLLSGMSKYTILINNTPVQINKGSSVRIQGATNIAVDDDGSFLITF